MTENNLIQWPRAVYWDKAWNPVTGCSPCSPACDHCYARNLFETRFHRSFAPTVTKRVNPPTKGVVFAGNMTDLFGEWVDKEKSIGFISATQERRGATFLYLTKRVSRMCDILNHGWVCEKDYHKGEDILPELLLVNHYFGFTAENQEWFNKRIEQALDMRDSANKWLSLEPLLGYVDLYPVIRHNHPDWNIKWIVVGCESGPNRRPCSIKWVESIVDQCRAADVPVFVKQLDIGGKCETDINRFPAHLRIRQVPWAKENNTNC